jgi:hypothetical protein
VTKGFDLQVINAIYAAESVEADLFVKSGWP